MTDTARSRAALRGLRTRYRNLELRPQHDRLRSQKLHLKKQSRNGLMGPEPATVAFGGMQNFRTFVKHFTVVGSDAEFKHISFFIPEDQQGAAAGSAPVNAVWKRTRKEHSLFTKGDTLTVRASKVGAELEMCKGVPSCTFAATIVAAPSGSVARVKSGGTVYERYCTGPCTIQLVPTPDRI